MVLVVVISAAVEMAVITVDSTVKAVELVNRVMESVAIEMDEEGSVLVNVASC